MYSKGQRSEVREKTWEAAVWEAGKPGPRGGGNNLKEDSPGPGDCAGNTRRDWLGREQGEKARI